MSEEKGETSLENFIKKTREYVVQGLGEWDLSEPIKLELSVIVKGKAGGGLDIQVVNFGAKAEAEQVQKVSLAISPKDKVKEAKRNAEIAKAEAQKKLANEM